MWEKVYRTRILSLAIVGVMLVGLIAAARQLPLTGVLIGPQEMVSQRDNCDWTVVAYHQSTHADS